jgi:hypothetical protein
MSARLGPMLREFAKGRKSAVLVVIVGVVGVAIGIHFAPDLVGNAAHRRYEPFFGAAAGLITGIFIVLLLEARHITSSTSLAVTTVFFVGASATAAVAGLLPDLSDTPYTVAFAAVVGGGLAALTSTIVLAGAALIEAREIRAQELLEEMRALQQAANPGASGTAAKKR